MKIARMLAVVAVVLFGIWIYNAARHVPDPDPDRRESTEMQIENSSLEPASPTLKALTEVMMRKSATLTVLSEKILPEHHRTGPEYVRTFDEPIEAIAKQEIRSDSGRGWITIFLFENESSARRAFDNASKGIAATNRLHRIGRAVLRLSGKASSSIEVNGQIRKLQQRMNRE
jgi:hypothetical protein